MTNKKLLLIAVIFIITIVGTVGVFAQDVTFGTADLVISGTIDKLVTIGYTPIGTPGDLDLTTTFSGAVATINETSNVFAGYSIDITSATGSKFAGTAGNTDEVSYTATYDAANVDFAGAGAGNPVTVYDSDVDGKRFGATNITFAIAYTGDPALLADTYSDTITFEIYAK